jgi:hypothetical protein
VLRHAAGGVAGRANACWGSVSAAGREERRARREETRQPQPSPFHSAVFRISYGLPVLKQVMRGREPLEQQISSFFQNERLVALPESDRVRQTRSQWQADRDNNNPVLKSWHALPYAYGILSVRGLGETAPKHYGYIVCYCHQGPRKIRKLKKMMDAPSRRGCDMCTQHTTPTHCLGLLLQGPCEPLCA